jgi:hypothetical protein
MQVWNRRTFLSAAASAPLFADLAFLAPLSRAAAAEPVFDPTTVQPSDDLLKLVKLIRETPREDCVKVFVAQLRGGLSYQQFLAALFLARCRMVILIRLRRFTQLIASATRFGLKNACYRFSGCSTAWH